MNKYTTRKKDNMNNYTITKAKILLVRKDWYLGNDLDPGVFCAKHQVTLVQGLRMIHLGNILEAVARVRASKALLDASGTTGYEDSSYEL